MRSFAKAAASAAVLLLSLPALAKDDDDKSKDKDDDKPRESVTYTGIGLTRVSTDFDNLKDAVNLQLVLGFRVPTFDWFGAEVEIGTTIIPGENESNTSSGGGGGACGGILQPPCPPGTTNTQDLDELQMNNIAAYAVFRSPGRLYGMGKIGYRYVNASIEELMEDDRSGTAWGAGAGYRWGETLSGVELFYTKFSDRIDYIGFTLNYGFDGRDRD